MYRYEIYVKQNMLKTYCNKGKKMCFPSFTTRLAYYKHPNTTRLSCLGGEVGSGEDHGKKYETETDKKNCVIL